MTTSAFPLGPVERRVLGCLVEKHLATPDYYPMTLKALVAAANQKNNRDPVMSLTDEVVEQAIHSLQRQGFVMAIKADTGWATRFRHELDRKPGISVKEQAILCELLLRGPQTEGELRTRASRMCTFEDMETVQENLQHLREFTPPLAVRLSPDGAMRGVRHAHLLYPEEELAQVIVEGATSREPHVVHVPAPPEAGPELVARVAALEARLAAVEGFLSRELGMKPDGTSE